MAKVIIFGLRDFAQFANFYLKHDSEHEVVAFTVSRSYLPETPEFEGKPVVAFEDIERQFSPLEYKMFAPMSHARMNRTREGVYNSVKQ
ncbi:MAG: sugar O-acyltransferase, partial [Polyangiaceae bacterium]